MWVLVFFSMTSLSFHFTGSPLSWPLARKPGFISPSLWHTVNNCDCLWEWVMREWKERIKSDRHPLHTLGNTVPLDREKGSHLYNCRVSGVWSNIDSIAAPTAIGMPGATKEENGWNKNIGIFLHSLWLIRGFSLLRSETEAFPCPFSVYM